MLMRISTLKNLQLQTRSCAIQTFSLHDSMDAVTLSKVYPLGPSMCIFFDLVLEQLYFQNRVPGYSGVSARQKSNLRLFSVNDVIQEFIPHN